MAEDTLKDLTDPQLYKGGPAPEEEGGGDHGGGKDDFTLSGGGPGGGTSSGDSSGGSSGGSSVGGGAPADPDAPLIAAAKSKYFALWGQPAPADYIERLIHSGLNIFEFELNERAKPAFRRTKTYRDEADSRWVAQLRSLGVL